MSKYIQGMVEKRRVEIPGVAGEYHAVSTPDDPESALHSMLVSYSDRYLGLDMAGRAEYARNMRRTVASAVTREDWLASCAD